MNAVVDLTYEQISNAVDRLNKAQRSALLTKLIEELDRDAEDDPDFLSILSPDDFRAELDRRIKEMDEHPERLIPWEQVKKELLEEVDD
ncbi:MAG: addiction module protein [Gemmatales bacterium]